MSRGHLCQTFYEGARSYIAGHVSLFSKHPDYLLPEHWPSYYREAKGSRIIASDGVEYLDMSNCGAGACPLGYGNEHVDDMVHEAVDRGVACMLNSEYEVQLAERLVELHSDLGMEQVKFTRSGGEAIAVAVRIARAFTRRNVIATMGHYHGWHDVSMSGIKTEQYGGGILSDYRVDLNLHSPDPRVMLDDYKSGLAAILIDPMYVDLEVRQTIYEFCRRTGTLLIHDEITSGYRSRVGAHFREASCPPDLVVLGKGMANGYALSAVLGSRRVMSACDESFISSTHWSESIGFAAGLATIEEWIEPDSKGIRVGDHLREIGEYFTTKVNAMVEEVHGFADLSRYYALYVNHKLSQLCHVNWSGNGRLLHAKWMLDKCVLVGPSFYPMATHTISDVDRYVDLTREFLMQYRTERKSSLAEGGKLFVMDIPEDGKAALRKPF